MKVTGKPPYLLKVQDGRYDYIETGSLISIRKNTQFITIPSEEKAIQMKPMDFEEFKWALGDTESIPLLRIFWEKKPPLKEAHRTVYHAGIPGQGLHGKHHI